MTSTFSIEYNDSHCNLSSDVYVKAQDLNAPCTSDPHSSSSLAAKYASVGGRSPRVMRLRWAIHTSKAREGS